MGSEFQVNSFTTGAQLAPAVVADGTGDFVVVWMADGQDGSSWGVFGQRLLNWIFVEGFGAGDACAWSAAVGGGC